MKCSTKFFRCRLRPRRKSNLRLIFDRALDPHRFPNASIERERSRGLESIVRLHASDVIYVQFGSESVERNRRFTIKLYSQLFTLKQEVEGGLIDAPIELAWAAGMMLWKYASGNLSYPLLSTIVELSLNPETAAMEVQPRDSVPRVESDWFTANDVAGIAEVERAAKAFFAKPDMYFCPLDHGTFEPLLRTAVTHLDSAGAYVPDSAMPGDRSIPKPEVDLKVTDTWVLFARPRTNSEFIRDLERFKAKVESQTTLDSVPGAVRAVITEPSNESAEVPLPSFRGVASTYSGGAESTTEAQHLYFPKSFNDEQVRIVQLLDSCDGVVVQGPPGTGKKSIIGYRLG